MPPDGGDEVEVAVRDPRGPTGFVNWRRAIAKEPARERLEFPLYSDSYISGQIDDGLGPYRLFNNLAVHQLGSCRPVITLACDFHAQGGGTKPSMDATDESGYHGGDIAEELAALFGLALGIRLRPSSHVRSVPLDDEGRTSYRAEDPATVPTLPHRTASVLPRLPARPPETTRLTTELVEDYPALDPEDAIALVRTARLYQQALWIADTDTSLAWVMLVSAVEAAALRWAGGNTDAVSSLAAWRPDLEQRLRLDGGDALVAFVASELKDLTKATGRFVKFLVKYLPDEPAERPRFGRIKWSASGLRPVFSRIYEYRSRALHAGIPVPAPMCRAPFRDANGVACDTPAGLAEASSGATWLQADTPILFHAFEHIARGALSAWWRELCRNA